MKKKTTKKNYVQEFLNEHKDFIDSININAWYCDIKFKNNKILRYAIYGINKTSNEIFKTMLAKIKKHERGYILDNNDNVIALTPENATTIDEIIIAVDMLV